VFCEHLTFVLRLAARPTATSPTAPAVPLVAQVWRAGHPVTASRPARVGPDAGQLVDATRPSRACRVHKFRSGGPWTTASTRSK